MNLIKVITENSRGQIEAMGGTIGLQGDGELCRFVSRNEDIKALVVAQPKFAMECIKAGTGFPAVLDDMAQIVGEEVKLIDLLDVESLNQALSRAAGCLIVAAGPDGRDTAEGGDDCPGYAITVGRSLHEAQVAMTVLEKGAMVFIKAKVIGGVKPVSLEEAVTMRKHYLEHYSQARQQTVKPCQFEPREQKLRQELVDYGNKLVSCGLVQGTWGNLSVRLDKDFMLVTPSGLDYDKLSLGDMVKVNIHTLEYQGEQKPTSEKSLHARIYQCRSDIDAVIHTHSTYCSIFGAAHCDMPVPTGYIKVAPYGPPGSHELTENTVSAMGNDFGCIMANHGMIGCGRDLAEALLMCQNMERWGQERIEFLEKGAR